MRRGEGGVIAAARHTRRMQQTRFHMIAQTGGDDRRKSGYSPRAYAWLAGMNAAFAIVWLAIGMVRVLRSGPGIMPSVNSFALALVFASTGAGHLILMVRCRRGLPPLTIPYALRLLHAPEEEKRRQLLWPWTFWIVVGLAAVVAYGMLTVGYFFWPAS